MAGGNKGAVVEAKLKGDILAFDVKTAAHIYRGTMVCVDTTVGYAVQGTDAANRYFLGISEEEADNTSGADAAIRVRVRRKGIFKMYKKSNLAATDIGKPVAIYQGQESAQNEMVDLVANTSKAVLVGVITKLIGDTGAPGYVFVDIMPAAWEVINLAAHVALADGSGHNIRGVKGDVLAEDATDPEMLEAKLLYRAATYSYDGAVTLTLPALSGLSVGLGTSVRITKTGATAGAFTFHPDGTDRVNGVNADLALYMRQYDSCVLSVTASGWVVSDVKLATPTLTLSATGNQSVTIDQLRTIKTIIVPNTAALQVTLNTLTAADAGLEITILKSTSDAHAVTLATEGAETINGGNTDTDIDAQYDTKTLVWCGATIGWVIKAQKIAA